MIRAAVFRSCSTKHLGLREALAGSTTVSKICSNALKYLFWCLKTCYDLPLHNQANRRIFKSTNSQNKTTDHDENMRIIDRIFIENYSFDLKICALEKLEVVLIQSHLTMFSTL